MDVLTSSHLKLTFSQCGLIAEYYTQKAEFVDTMTPQMMER